jgi:hypothetical protein
MLVKCASLPPTAKVALSGTLGILAGVGIGAFLASKHEDAKGLLGLLADFASKDVGKTTLAALGGLAGAKVALSNQALGGK